MINLFASGCSVLDIAVDELLRIKNSGILVTTNYPLELIDARIVSDIHSFGDKDTARFANSYFRDKTTVLMVRKVIHEHYRELMKDITITHIIDPERFNPFNETTFLLTLQYLLDMYPNEHINVYGLDFAVRKDCNRWYDKYVDEKDERGNHKFTGQKVKVRHSKNDIREYDKYDFRLTKRKKDYGYATDNFYSTFEMFYIINRLQLDDRTTFHGLWKPQKRIDI